MQCYGYEVLCRTLMNVAKQGGVVLTIAEAADVLEAHGINDIDQLPELLSLALEMGQDLQRAA